jgi:hypothetical protein
MPISTYENDLYDERARLLDEVDDIVNTAREANRSQFDARPFPRPGILRRALNAPG